MAGCPHPAEMWQSRLGYGWITSSGRMPLHFATEMLGGAASLPPCDGTRPTAWAKPLAPPEGLTIPTPTAVFRLIAPFQGWGRLWAGQPGALPRAGVCRAVGAPGSWQASQDWGRRVGRLVDFDGHPVSGTEPQRRRDVFPHDSASLRLGGRFIFSRFMRPEMPWERVGKIFQVHGAESPAEALRRGGFGFRMGHDAIGPAARCSFEMSP